MTHRQLAAILFWLDRVPPCAARWEVEAVVLEALEQTTDEDDAPRSSGVFLLEDGADVDH